MTNGFQPQPNYGAPQQYAQPPVQQAQQFGGQPQTGGFFTQQAPPNGQVPQQFQQQAPQAQQYVPAQPETTEDTENYFAGGAAWISWDSDKGYQDGSWRGGLILGKRIVPQTDIDTGEVRFQKKGDTSKPLTMLVLTLQTAERADPDDDGRREMPVRSGLRAAAKKEFEAQGAKDLEIGSWFYAARVRKEPIPNSNFKRNIFEAVYRRPGSPDPMAGQPAYQAPVPPPQQMQPAPGQFAPQGYAPQQVPQFQGMAGDPNYPAQQYAPQQPGQFAHAAAPEMAQPQNPAMYNPAIQQGYAPGPDAVPQQMQPAPGQFAPQGAINGAFNPGTPTGGFAPQPAAPGQQGFAPGTQQAQQTPPGGSQPAGAWSPFSPPS
jgi:hypothetical protein